MMYIGTAGWTIPRPVADRFPAEGSSLERYGHVLSCSEINSTFKHEHRPSTYARWAVIRRFPDGGRGERLGHTYLFFESNFNGTWDQYIDAFSEVVPARMKAIWGSSYGFPGPIPVEPFKAYIRKNEYVANHYWSSYPGATTTEIISADHVAAAIEDLRRRADGLTPEKFRAEYERMLTDVQGHL